MSEDTAEGTQGGRTAPSFSLELPLPACPCPPPQNDLLVLSTSPNIPTVLFDTQTLLALVQCAGTSRAPPSHSRLSTLRVNSFLFFSGILYSQFGLDSLLNKREILEYFLLMSVSLDDIKIKMESDNYMSYSAL